MGDVMPAAEPVQVMSLATVEALLLLEYLIMLPTARILTRVRIVD